MPKEFQHVKRFFNADEYLEIKQGGRAFDITLDTPNQDLEIGDVITLQEVDDDGNETGNHIVKKISTKLSLSEVKLPDYVDRAKAIENGISIIGWVPPEQFLLSSVYNYGFTVHLALDRIDKGEMEDVGTEGYYEIVEGPFFAPTLTSPDFSETSLLADLKVKRWPAGRYSITIMVYVDYGDLNNGKAPSASIVDVLVLACVIQQGEQGKEVAFAKLDPAALIRGVVLDEDSGDRVIPAHPSKIDEVHADRQLEERMPFETDEPMSEEDLRTLIKEARQQGAYPNLSNEDIDSMSYAELLGTEQVDTSYKDYEDYIPSEDDDYGTGN